MASGRWRDNFVPTTSRDRDNSPRGYGSKYKQKMEKTFKTRPELSNADLSTFLRVEREKADESRGYITPSEQEMLQHCERVSMFRHNEVQDEPFGTVKASYSPPSCEPRKGILPVPTAQKFWRDCLDYGKEVIEMTPREVERELLSIFEETISDPVLSSAKRIDCVVRKVKNLLVRMNYSQGEIREEVKIQVERLIKAKNWTISYEEALQEGTIAHEPLCPEHDEPFQCAFCKLKYNPEALRCKVCDVEYLLRIDLDAHIFVDHQIPIDQIFDCPFCPESFHGNPKAFRDHMYVSHFCADDHLECPYGCKILVLKSMSSEDHYKKYHFCDLCGDNINNNMKYHKERFHWDEYQKPDYPSNWTVVSAVRHINPSSGSIVMRRRDPSPDVMEMRRRDPSPDVMEMRRRDPSPGVMEMRRRDPSPGVMEMRRRDPSLGVMEMRRRDPSLGVMEMRRRDPSPDVMEMRRRDPSPGVMEMRRRDPSPDVMEMRRRDPSPGVMEMRRRDPSPGVTEMRRRDPSPDVMEMRRRDPSPGVMEMRRRDPSLGVMEMQRRDPSPGVMEMRRRDPSSGVMEMRSRDPSPGLFEMRRDPSLSPLDMKRSDLSPGSMGMRRRDTSPDIIPVHRSPIPDAITMRRSLSPRVLPVQKRSLSPETSLVAQAKEVLNSIGLANAKPSYNQHSAEKYASSTLSQYSDFDLGSKIVDYPSLSEVSNDSGRYRRSRRDEFDDAVAADYPGRPETSTSIDRYNRTRHNRLKDVAPVDYPRLETSANRDKHEKITPASDYHVNSNDEVVNIDYPGHSASVASLDRHERSTRHDMSDETPFDYQKSLDPSLGRTERYERSNLNNVKRNEADYPKPLESSDFRSNLIQRDRELVSTEQTGFDYPLRYQEYPDYSFAVPARSQQLRTDSESMRLLNARELYSSTTSTQLNDDKDVRELYGGVEQKGAVVLKNSSTTSIRWLECKECGLKTPDGGYICSVCNEGIYTYRIQLNVHLRDMHGYRVPSAEMHCEICRERFSNSEEILLHVFSVAHVCASEHLKCKQDPDCDILVFSDAELASHAKRYHKSTHTNKSLEERDPHFSFSLAPRSTDLRAQSILNISKTRDKFLKMPVDHEASECLTSDPKSRRNLIAAGFMHCTKCSLMYHPGLSTCGRCSLKFIIPQAVMEHMINVHDVPEIYSQKRCPFCREILQSYTEFLNHLVTHFCREHSECEFGCTQLVIGGPKEVVKHVLEGHSSDDKKAPQKNATRELCTKPLKEIPVKALVTSFDMKTLKCEICSFQPPIEVSNCELCPKIEEYVYPTPGDVGIHKHLEHKIMTKTEYSCFACNKGRKFNGDGLNQHQYSQQHKFCSRGHFICVKCKKMYPQVMRLSHLNKCGKDGTEPTGKVEKFEEIEEVEPPVEVKNRRMEVVKRDWRHCKFCPLSVNFALTYSCTMCDSVFYTEVDCDFHLFSCHGDNTVLPFKCTCGYSTRNANCWTDHRREEHNLCSEHVACRNKSCIWLFPSKKDLLGHYQQSGCKLNTQQSKFTQSVKSCDTCHNIVGTESCCVCMLCTPLQKSFPTVADYASHLTLNHRRFLAGDFKCPACPISFEDPEKLKKHMTSTHAFCSSGHALCSKRADCSILIVDSPVNVITHKCTLLTSEMSLKMMALLKSKGCYRCINCNLGFEEINLIQCSECPIVFLSREELAGHEKLDHNKVFNSAFPCSFCNSSFPGHPDKLLMHRKVVHQYCPFHKFEFGRVSCLHTIIETKALTGLLNSDAQRFTCPTCSKDVRSTNKISPPQQCPLCPFNPGFYCEEEFVFHMKNVHGKVIEIKLGERQCFYEGCKFVPKSVTDTINHRVKGHGMCASHLVCPMFHCRRIFSTGEAFLVHAMSCKGTKPIVILDGLSLLRGFESMFELVVRPFYHYSCEFCPFNVATCMFIKCKICEKTGDMSERPQVSALSFLLHLVQCHSFAEPREMFTCQFCLYSTFSASVMALFQHMKTEHNICSNHFVCYNSCLTVYNSERKYKTAHYLKKNCNTYPEQMFENQQFSYSIHTSLDIVNRVLFKFSRSSVKFVDFSGIIKVSNESGKTTLRSIFTAAAGLLPSELLEETKKKLKAELTKDKKKQDKDKEKKKAKSPPKKRRSRSRTPPRRLRSRSRSRRRSGSRRSRSRRRRSISRSKRSISRSRRSISRSRSRKRSMSRRRLSRSVSRRRVLRRSRSRSISRPRAPIKSRSISKSRKRSPSKSPRSKVARRSPRSSSSERKISRNVVDTSTKLKSRKSDDKKKSDSRKSEIKLISAADGIESKSLSTLISEYSEPHALQALATSYAKEASPEKEVKKEAGVEEDGKVEQIDESLEAPKSNWEDVMSNMLSYTDQLLVGSNHVEIENGITMIDRQNDNLSIRGNEKDHLDRVDVDDQGLEASQNFQNEEDGIQELRSTEEDHSGLFDNDECSNWDEFLLEENDDELQQELEEEYERLGEPAETT